MPSIVSASYCPEALMASGGAIGRIFAAYCCGCDAVVCEAARLLLRFWAPAAARSGTGEVHCHEQCLNICRYEQKGLLSQRFARTKVA
jgi:hypothetical protein